MAPERYAILVKYRHADDFVPVPTGWGPHMPDGGSYKWDDAVALMERMRHQDPENTYMMTPVIADPI